MNFKPIFTLTPNPGLPFAVVSAANTNRDGTGTVVQVFQAGAEGSYIDRIVWQPTGTNVPSVGRMWLNNGGDPTVATNNAFLGEVILSTNVSTEVAALTPAVWSAGFAIPANSRIYAAVGTVVAAGFAVTCPGSGDY